MEQKVKKKKRLCVNDIPNETLLRCAIRDNKMLLEKIRNLEAEKEELKREVNQYKKLLTQKEQEFANWKKNSKLFYNGIEKVANLVAWKDYDYKSVTYRANKKEFLIEEL